MLLKLQTKEHSSLYGLRELLTESKAFGTYPTDQQYVIRQQPQVQASFENVNLAKSHERDLTVLFQSLQRL